MSKKCKRNETLVDFIYFLYILIALKISFPGRVSDILQCSSPETRHGMVVVNFNGFSVAVYCLLFIHASYDT